MKIRDLMTTKVASVRSDEPLSAAARLMWNYDCGAIPVVDGAERVVGMITDRDICMASWSKDQPPSSIRISDVISRDPLSCGPDDTIVSAENLMRNKQVRRVPIVDSERKLVGILSLADIVAEARRSGSRPAAPELAPSEIAMTLAYICQPRAQSSRATG